MAEQVKIALRGQFPDTEIPKLFPLIRKFSMEKNADIQIILSFPESPRQGGFFTRPHGQGGPGLFITLSAPVEQEILVRQAASELEKIFS